MLLLPLPAAPGIAIAINNYENLIALKRSLEKLDHLINFVLDPEKINHSEITPSQLEGWINEVAAEKENLFIGLLRKSLDLETGTALELLIQQYQAILVSLLNKVNRYRKEFPFSPMTTVYESVLKSLEELLSVLEQRFARYFNGEEQVPETQVCRQQTEIKKEAKALHKILQNKVEERLINIILLPLNAFLKNKHSIPVTYYTMFYLKTLLAELKDLNPESEHLEEALFSLGIYLNVNSVEAVNYFIDRISIEINAAPQPELKRRKLMHWLRKINQLPIKSNTALKPRLASLREQLGAWIAEEIDLLEMELTLPLPSIPGQNGEEEAKVHTSLSVPQLALLIRAAKDAGMITNKNQTALLKTIAKVFGTPNTEAISVESLRIKYYVAESGAKQTLKDLLMEMYKKLHSY